MASSTVYPPTDCCSGPLTPPHPYGLRRWRVVTASSLIWSPLTRPGLIMRCENVCCGWLCSLAFCSGTRLGQTELRGLSGRQLCVELARLL